MTTADVIATARQQALGDMPRRTARRFPDKTAIVDGSKRLSFRELNDAIDRKKDMIKTGGENVVIADQLPKNPSGKILKRELRTEHAEIGR